MGRSNRAGWAGRPVRAARNRLVGWACTLTMGMLGMHLAHLRVGRTSGKLGLPNRASPSFLGRGSHAQCLLCMRPMAYAHTRCRMHAGRVLHACCAHWAYELYLLHACILLHAGEVLACAGGIPCVLHTCRS